jgi:hypothetical protein
MTRDFGKPASGIPPGVMKGSRVIFEFVQQPDGSFVLRSIAPGAAQ